MLDLVAWPMAGPPLYSSKFPLAKVGDAKFMLNVPTLVLVPSFLGQVDVYSPAD